MDFYYQTLRTLNAWAEECVDALALLSGRCEERVANVEQVVE